MDPMPLLVPVAEWAAGQDDVRAVALVGSHARGTATPGSDIDLVLVVDDVERRLTDRSWVARFGDVASVTHEDWGPVQSLRVTYAAGEEVEFGLTSIVWVEPPLDAGTARVIRDGRMRCSTRRGCCVAQSTRSRPSRPGRLSAKVVLVDHDDRVLLFRGQDPSSPDRGSFWFPPGGGVDGQEDLHAAARREVFEEVGLDLSDGDLGPVVLRREASFSFEGRSYLQNESYFVVRVERVEVDASRWTDQERRTISGHRLWPLSDLTSTDETVYPDGLSDLLRNRL